MTRQKCANDASMMRHRCVNDAPINAIDSLRVYDDTLAVPPCHLRASHQRAVMHVSHFTCVFSCTNHSATRPLLKMTLNCGDKFAREN
uniref:Uncharacterized protein n=1 Tax=Caenorhabditis japonica TaxID=281687 RepID=A0A8R1EA12_CAEJA